MKEQVIIDVRERDEYDAGHVEGSINVPLSSFSSVAPNVLKQLRDKDVTIMCYSGKRAENAYNMAQGFGYSQAVDYKVYPGGVKAWIEEGKPVVTSEKPKMSLMRQTQLSMGALVVVFSAMSLFVDPNFGILAAGMGIGMMFAGLTGNCAMANAVSKMPWNKAKA
ncbi:MAG: rhodanese-like domain-containing protein [Gammaproteobacteria bacterium]|nr:rhodanese-like domain-containing protein [Gammaproteobacteria bacterium]